MKEFCLVFLFSGLFVYSQSNALTIKKALPQIEKGEFEKIFINDSLVKQYLDEYLIEAEKRGLFLGQKITDINWILIEPESSNSPLTLKEMDLGKIDKEHKLILLSRYCLLDRLILKSTLYRELTHYFGMPYDVEGLVIMSIKKPYGYSYAWLDDFNIREIELDKLFETLKKHLNN